MKIIKIQLNIPIPIYFLLKEKEIIINIIGNKLKINPNINSAISLFKFFAKRKPIWSKRISPELGISIKIMVKII